MKRILSAAVVLCALLTVGLMQAQAPPPPPAELQKLDFMTGHWTATGTATMGPPGTAFHQVEREHRCRVDGRKILFGRTQ